MRKRNGEKGPLQGIRAHFANSYTVTELVFDQFVNKIIIPQTFGYEDQLSLRPLINRRIDPLMLAEFESSETGPRDS